MKVNLVSYSQPTQDFKNDLDNIQDLIAFCARVSNPSNQMNKETNEKLIKYLIKHQHWSPLEMVSACLEIQTTRDIAHQIVRHRSFAFQEFSQRYADPKEQGEMFEYSEARLQDPKNRQNSVDVEDEKLQLDWLHAQMRIAHLAKKEYDWAIKKGIAKTRLYMNGTIRSWVHYIELRGSNGTQKEHMDIAHACAKVIAEIFPLAKEI